MSISHVSQKGTVIHRSLGMMDDVNACVEWKFIVVERPIHSLYPSSSSLSNL